MITGNIGEWSEFYAFIKILTDKVLYSADENLQKTESDFFPVLQIIREESHTGKKIYDIKQITGKIHISDLSEREIGIVNSSEIKLKVREIFEGMKGSGNGAFSMPAGQKLMKKLKCTQMKASNGKKEDLVIKIHDPVSPIEPKLGFSIKSMLGSPSTLFNASGASNFRYKVKGESIDMEDINVIGGQSKIRDRVKKIQERGGEIVFDSLESEIFRRNLRKIDSVLPEILAELILAFLKGKARKLSEIISHLAEDGVWEEKFNFSQGDIEYKMKEFLVSSALGMTAAKEWDGIAKAHGGYIIVREDGEIVCYNLYNRNEFQKYLYNNTKLETPSTTKHHYGDAFEEGENKYINFNLQIRFNK